MKPMAEKPLILYLCYKGGLYEGVTVRSAFKSEESAIKFIQSNTRRDNKKYRKWKIENPAHEVGLWKKVKPSKRDTAIHIWRNDYDLWLIIKMEVLP